jgi:hypothetical protein
MLARQMENHRKQIKYRLTAALIFGGLLGFHSSAFFGNMLVTDPDHPGFPLNTWAGIRETAIAVLTVHGILIWPTVFIVIDLLFSRRSRAKLAAKIAIADIEARLAETAATEQRIADAKKNGVI